MAGHIPSSPSGGGAGVSNIFDPTALPDHHNMRNFHVGTKNLSSEAGSKDTSMMISGGFDGAAIKAAAHHGSDMAKMQIQYNLMLKENNLLRERQDKLIEEARLLKVQFE